MAASEQKELTVGYWDIRGLAQPIRMALALGGVEFNDKMYTCKPKVTINKETGKEEHGWDTSDWFDVKKESLGKEIDFCNLPYIQVQNMAEGTSFAESMACFTYAAEVAGHHDNFTQAQKCKALAFLIQVQVIRDLAIGHFYGFGGEPTYDGGERTKVYSADITKKFEKFSAILGEKKYLMGDDICSADFHLCEMIYQHYLMDKTIFAKMDNLKNYAKRFFALEKIAEMEKKCELPINNKMAKFGAAYIENVDLTFGMSD